MSKSIRILKKNVRRAKRSWKYVSSRRWIVLLCFMLIAFIIMPTMQAKEEPDPDVSQLLETVAKGESKGNYNAYYGHAGNTEIKFTEMSVGQVLAWQQSYVDQGKPSSAVGKYQFVRRTLDGLTKELKVDHSARFDEQLQDRLAKRLLERRGLKDYVHGKITQEQFAHNLSKEWAALPRVIGEKPADSYYSHDGLNHSRISIEEINQGIASLHQQTP